MARQRENAEENCTPNPAAASSQGRSTAPQLQGALTRYAQADHGALPPNLLQLLPYLSPPATAAMLERYTLLRSGNLDDAGEGPWLVRESASVDPEHDTRITVGQRTGKLPR